MSPVSHRNTPVPRWFADFFKISDSNWRNFFLLVGFISSTVWRKERCERVRKNICVLDLLIRSNLKLVAITAGRAATEKTFYFLSSFLNPHERKKTNDDKNDIRDTDSLFLSKMLLRALVERFLFWCLFKKSVVSFYGRRSSFFFAYTHTHLPLANAD